MAFVTKKESGAKTVVKGFITGATQVMITYPTEFIKTALQLQSKTNPEYTSMLDCAKKTVQANGFSGLYRGAGARVWGAGFQQMCRWGTYANVSNFFRDDNNKISFSGNVMAGAATGVVEAVIAVTPFETVKTRVLDDQRRGTGNYKGSGDAVVQIMKKEGPTGLYKGALPTILKQSANQAVRMPLQLAIFNVISFGDDSKKSSPIYNGIAGLGAGAGSVLLTQPQDCVKSRMQSETGKELYKGTVDCFMQMARNEGPACFFAGAIPRMIQVGMVNGISFAIYPMINQLLNKVW